nr:hypothetical protein [Chloroflexota bacterium]
MHRFRRAATIISIILVVCLSWLTACQPGRDKTVSIALESLYTQSGLALRVSGRNWRPGSQVTVGFNAPESQPQDSETIATTLTDASGNFVALFPFPTDKHWALMPEIWIVAHTFDFSQVAVTSFHNPQLFTPTPLPRSTLPAIPTAIPIAYVLGYVEKIALDSRSLILKPLDGQARVITWHESTQVIAAGQPAQLADMRVGDLIEASGQTVTKDSLIADRIRILSRTTAEPSPTHAPTKPISAWRGEYYNNTAFSGIPTVTRSDPVIDFQWQNGSPAEGLPADQFAVRWTGAWSFEAGTYRFYAQVDDGVRLWLDAHLIIDRWHESTGALYSADAYLSTGSHAVRVEYFDAWDNAYARVWWEYRGPNIAVAAPDWKAEYYDNMTLSGTPFLVLNERAIDFDWGAGAPATGMNTDHFSARWTRTISLDTGTYRFYALSDDGVQLWIDDTIVIDHWMDGAAQTYVGDLHLLQGSHTIRVHYYENAGQAVIKVWWELLPATPTPTYTPVPPTPTFTPLPPTATATSTLETPQPTPE